MTVKELIEALSKLPPDAVVIYRDVEQGEQEVTDVAERQLVLMENKYPNGTALSYYEVYERGRYLHAGRPQVKGVELG